MGEKNQFCPLFLSYSKGVSGCGRFLNLHICWCSSLLKGFPRFSFGMTRVLGIILMEQMNVFCFNLNSAIKSPKLTIFSFCDSTNRTQNSIWQKIQLKKLKIPKCLNQREMFKKFGRRWRFSAVAAISSPLFTIPHWSYQRSGEPLNSLMKAAAPTFQKRPHPPSLLGM